MRASRYYSAEERQYGPHVLQCAYCGNTTAFYVDLRLKYSAEVIPDGQLALGLDEITTKEQLQKLAQQIEPMIDKAIYQDQPIIFCANCHQAHGIDLQERLLDHCRQLGCPGCAVCGQYLPEDEVCDICTRCIQDHNGRISEEDCFSSCPYFTDGLLEVLQHYGHSLADLKQELGY